MSNAENKKVLFTQLYDLYFPMVRQLCLGYVQGDGHAAEDLSQDVFINIWNGLEKFRNASSYKTWVYRITVNTCLLYLRTNQKRQRTMELKEVGFEKGEEYSKDEEQYQMLYQSIGELLPLERLIIMMVLDELTYEEIGAILGISQVHLRVKIYRVKNKMRQIIQKKAKHAGHH